LLIASKIGLSPAEDGTYRQKHAIQGSSRSSPSSTRGVLPPPARTERGKLLTPKMKTGEAWVGFAGEF